MPAQVIHATTTESKDDKGTPLYEPLSLVYIKSAVFFHKTAVSRD